MAGINNDFATINASFRNEYIYETSKHYVEKMQELLGKHSTQSDVYDLYFDNDKKLEIPVFSRKAPNITNNEIKISIPKTIFFFTILLLCFIISLMLQLRHE